MFLFALLANMSGAIHLFSGFCPSFVLIFGRSGSRKLHSLLFKALPLLTQLDSSFVSLDKQLSRFVETSFAHGGVASLNKRGEPFFENASREFLEFVVIIGEIRIVPPPRCMNKPIRHTRGYF